MWRRKICKEKGSDGDEKRKEVWKQHFESITRMAVKINVVLVYPHRGGKR